MRTREEKIESEVLLSVEQGKLTPFLLREISSGNLEHAYLYYLARFYDQRVQRSNSLREILFQKEEAPIEIIQSIRNYIQMARFDLAKKLIEGLKRSSSLDEHTKNEVLLEEVRIQYYLKNFDKAVFLIRNLLENKNITLTTRSTLYQILGTCAYELEDKDLFEDALSKSFELQEFVSSEYHCFFLKILKIKLDFFQRNDQKSLNRSMKNLWKSYFEKFSHRKDFLLAMIRLEIECAKLSGKSPVFLIRFAEDVSKELQNQVHVDLSQFEISLYCHDTHFLFDQIKDEEFRESLKDSFERLRDHRPKGKSEKILLKSLQLGLEDSNSEKEINFLFFKNRNLILHLPDRVGFFYDDDESFFSVLFQKIEKDQHEGLIPIQDFLEKKVSGTVNGFKMMVSRLSQKYKIPLKISKNDLSIEGIKCKTLS